MPSPILTSLRVSRIVPEDDAPSWHAPDDNAPPPRDARELPVAKPRAGGDIEGEGGGQIPKKNAEGLR